MNLKINAKLLLKKVLIFLGFVRNQNFLNRHKLIKILISIFVIIIIFRIITLPNNQEYKNKAIKYKTKVYTPIRGSILDRNNNPLAITIIKSKINIDPSIIQMNGVNNIDSIWRINKQHKKTKIKQLKKIVKNIYQKKQKNSAIINKVNPAKLIADILKTDSNKLIIDIKKAKEQCNIYKQKIKKLKAKREINNNQAKKEIRKINAQAKNKTKFYCKREYIVKDNISYTSNIIKRIKELKQEKFLICKHNKLSISCHKKTINGLYIQNKNERFYPQAEILAPLIGVVNHKGTGVFGIESALNEQLNGTSGKLIMSKKNNSWNSFYNYKKDISAKNGIDLQLTIDSKVQFHLFNQIKNSVIANKAKSASGIILNPDGEILASVNYPSSDPNKGINKDYSHYLNGALANQYDVASTIKPLMTLLALDKNKIKIDDVLDIYKEEKSFKSRKKYKKLSITDIIVKSHTPGSINIGNKLTSKEIYQTWSKLGFGKALNILPNIETTGKLKHFYNWSKKDKKAMSYGYGPITISIAQLAKAYLVFANEGKIKELKLFKNLTQNNYETKIFNKKNTKQMIEILEKVVNHGTGKNAKIKNIQVAGKTGTARRVVNNKYNRYQHNVLFAGFAPSKKPQYIMVVIVENPQGKTIHEGGYIAAPIFKNVMNKLLSK